MKQLLAVLLLSIAAFAQGSNNASISGNITGSGTTCGVSNCVALALPSSAATATVTISGTFSATAQFEVSADGTNYVAVNGAPYPSGNSVTSATAAGTWTFPVGGMAVIRVRASAYSSGGINVGIQSSSAPFVVPNVGSVTVANTAGSGDPCQNPSVAKSSAAISLTSTTAAAVVALSSGKITYVCGFSATIQGSATTVGTLQFEYGTQTTNPCDTGTTTLTSAFQGNITANVPTLVTSPGGGSTQFATIASNQLCAVATGTTISVKGYLTYVQQ